MKYYEKLGLKEVKMRSWGMYIKKPKIIITDEM